MIRKALSSRFNVLPSSATRRRQTKVFTQRQTSRSAAAEFKNFKPPLEILFDQFADVVVVAQRKIAARLNFIADSRA